MARITISSPDAARIAKSFADLVSARGIAAATRRAVNKTGAQVRAATRAKGPELFGTSRAALRITGKAAAPGSEDPKYRLSLISAIPVSKLRAKHRKATRAGGRLQLDIDTPAIDAIRFRATAREGRAFRLLAAGPFAERFVGGVGTGAARAFARPEEGGKAELYQIRKDAERDLPAHVEREILAIINRRRK